MTDEETRRLAQSMAAFGMSVEELVAALKKAMAILSEMFAGLKDIDQAVAKADEKIREQHRQRSCWRHAPQKLYRYTAPTKQVARRARSTIRQNGNRNRT